MKRIILGLALALPFLISACNTIEGAGEDLSAGGKAIADSAVKTKDAIDNSTSR